MHLMAIEFADKDVAAHIERERSRVRNRFVHGLARRTHTGARCPSHIVAGVTCVDLIAVAIVAAFIVVEDAVATDFNFATVGPASIATYTIAVVAHFIAVDALIAAACGDADAGTARARPKDPFARSAFG